MSGSQRASRCCGRLGCSPRALFVPLIEICLIGGTFLALIELPAVNSHRRRKARLISMAAAPAIIIFLRPPPERPAYAVRFELPSTFCSIFPFTNADMSPMVLLLGIVVNSNVSKRDATWREGFFRRIFPFLGQRADTPLLHGKLY